MDVSKQQKLIVEAAMTAPGAFKPKFIGEKTGLAYNIVSPQIERLVAEKILVTDKENKTYTVTDEGRRLSRCSVPRRRNSKAGAAAYPTHSERTPFEVY
jgi:predicted transcriptional regulator